MKKLIYLPFLLLLAGSVHAQVVYGIYRDSLQKTYLVQVDPATAQLNIVKQAPINAFIVNSSTFDQQNHVYMFQGIDSSQARRLYSLEASTGDVLSDPPYTRNVYELQFDLLQQKMYGLVGSDPLNDMTFVEFNITNGTIDTLATISGLKAVAVGSATINSNNGKYFCIGFDQSQQMKLFMINSSTGQLIQTISLSHLYRELEFDVQANKLFALYNDDPGNINSPDQFVEIDTTSGAMTTLDTISGSYASFTGSSVFDHYTQTYIYLGRDASNMDHVYTIDASNGDVLAQPTFTYLLGELEVDNSSFGAAYYHNPTGIVCEGTKPAISIYPNPSSGAFTVTSSEAQKVVIRNIAGQGIYRNNLAEGTHQLDLGNAPNGIYIVQFISMNGDQQNKKVIIR